MTGIPISLEEMWGKREIVQKAIRKKFPFMTAPDIEEAAWDGLTTAWENYNELTVALWKQFVSER